VVRVGSQAEGGIKVGDRVGVGAQSDSCLGRVRGPCDECEAGLEQYCDRFIITYNGRHLNGSKTMGGYATHHRCPSHFAIRIPDGVPSEQAAPMMCGGATLYSPLRHHGCGPGKTVGIVGVGGLGHFGVVFAKAMGADRVVGISRRAAKRDEVLQMGADEYIATEDDKDWAKKHRGSLDLIISTVSSSKVCSSALPIHGGGAKKTSRLIRKQAPIVKYLGLLKRDGQMVQVGSPDDGAFTIPPGKLIQKRLTLTGSSIASPGEIRDMLDMVAKTGARFWVEKRPMSEANQAVVDMEDGKARFRYVLVNPTADKSHL
jgi:D-arabinose 1-dehydrogenase-like Zn-dependent alcohol dehydrogenase